jgi:P pilus assembly chaperone PapD
MKLVKSGLLILSLMLILVARSQAMSVSPMSADFDLIGAQTSVLYTVSNPSDEPINIEVSVEARKTSPDGVEVLDDSAEVKRNFSIFPGATIIPPKQKKGIRVVYVGPKDLASEAAYRINISETPAKSKDAQKTGVQMLRKFRTAGYVHPKNVKSDVKLLGTELAADGSLILKFQNQGTAHQLIRKISLLVTDETGHSAKVTEITDNSLLTNFLAGESRSIRVSCPASIKGKSVSAQLESLE